MIVKKCIQHRYHYEYQPTQYSVFVNSTALTNHQILDTLKTMAFDAYMNSSCPARPQC
jgi:hypothetical protein